MMCEHKVTDERSPFSNVIYSRLYFKREDICYSTGKARQLFGDKKVKNIEFSLTVTGWCRTTKCPFYTSNIVLTFCCEE